MKKETGQEYYARHTCRKYKNITGPLQGTGVGLLREAERASNIPR
jgi:hypothetical protein